MRKQIPAALLVVVACSALVGPGFADESTPVSPDAKAALSKADHLRIAAEHLEAAGLKDDARRLRHVGESPFILVDVRMIELPLTKLANMSAARYGGGKDLTVADLLKKLEKGGTPRRNDDSFGPSDPKLFALIDALLKDEVAMPRTEPSLMLLPGRSGYALEGGEIGYVEKDAQGNEHMRFKEYGTRADAVATLLPGNRIRLELRANLSEPDAANSINGAPAFKSRGIETGVELRSGETIAVGGLVEQRLFSEVVDGGGKAGASYATKEVRSHAETFETVVLVRVKIVTGDEAAKAETVK